MFTRSDLVRIYVNSVSVVCMFFICVILFFLVKDGGIVIYEENRLIAGAELAICVIGLIMHVRRVWRSKAVEARKSLT